MICERCGGQMKLRNGKFGPFWGCSNYPNCKNTRSTEKSELKGDRSETKNEGRAVEGKKVIERGVWNFDTREEAEEYMKGIDTKEYMVELRYLDSEGGFWQVERRLKSMT